MGYKYPFVLKCVNKTGSACCYCAWYRFCRGCVVSCSDALLPAAPAYLAIDWDPTALHLRYLGGQEKVRRPRLPGHRLGPDGATPRYPGSI